uniref:AlNc14C11G1405 protein n=1 Tax=Albugo laibachii Nc14 TaxID=890382 RepID=F0W327_9STRA|nr:AlNc14C11G1405 [Albugo laibachii Nc14]|eukprot:CCA15464.1 AlNc14C11G1405 [Albugo laibachii Nc14]
MFRKLDPSRPFIGELTKERVRRLTEDCEMVDASGEDRIANAPQLTRHLMYKGKTSKDKRESVKKYQDYYNTLLAYETCQNKPFVMPVSACVEVWTKEQILKFEMQKYAMEVTEQDWINYFREAGEPDRVDLTKIDAEMRKLKLDFTLIDANSLISRLRNQKYRFLDQYGLQEYVEHADPKLLYSGW